MIYQEFPKYMVYGGADPDGQFNPVTVASPEIEAMYAARGYVVPGTPDPAAYGVAETDPPPEMAAPEEPAP